MSVILKGIDLPKDVKEVCVMYKDKEGYLQTYIVKDIIQIPKGHGALKDGSNLVNMLGKKLDLIARERNSRSKSARLSLIRDLAIELYKEPTILESEEEE